MKLLFEITLKGIHNFFISSMYREYLKLVFLYGDKPRYERKNIKFLNYRFVVSDCRSFIPQFKDIFFEENYKFSTEKKCPLIYDCGANVGTSCVYFKKLFPNAKIKAFEADPVIASILEVNLKNNNIRDVVVFNKAVWINNNGVELSTNGADGASIIAYGDNKIMVDSVRLRELLQEEASIQMLKMDIEGAEAQVIEDCKDVLANVENIFIEYHSYRNYPQELNRILEILTNNNFRYFIKSGMKRDIPFINKTKRDNSTIDLLLNIYAYRVNI